MEETTIKEFLEAGCHFGHKTKRWNPKMKPFIYGVRNGIHIIDLQQTAELFRRAANYVREAASRGEKILFIGTKRQAQDIVAEEAARAGQYYVSNRWLGGTLTNFKTIKSSIERLKAIEKLQTDGSFERMPKKEGLTLLREKAKMDRNFTGIKDMAKLPGALFVIDPHKEHIPISEANKLGIPIVAIADTNCDPDLIDYAIPSNDDALRAIKLITGRIADAALEGHRAYQERLAGKEKDRDDERERDRMVAAASSGREKDSAGPVVEVIIRGEEKPSADAARA